MSQKILAVLVMLNENTCVWDQKLNELINPSHSFVNLSGWDSKETTLQMAFGVLSFNGRLLCDIYSVPKAVHIYMRSLLPRTCCWFRRHNSLPPNSASSPISSSRRWYWITCSLFPVFSMDKSLFIPPISRKAFPLTLWQLQAPKPVWTSRQMVVPPGEIRAEQVGRQGETRICRQARSKST